MMAKESFPWRVITVLKVLSTSRLAEHRCGFFDGGRGLIIIFIDAPARKTMRLISTEELFSIFWTPIVVGTPQCTIVTRYMHLQIKWPLTEEQRNGCNLQKVPNCLQHWVRLWHLILPHAACKDHKRRGYNLWNHSHHSVGYSLFLVSFGDFPRYFK